jgi:hypothetical protein
MKGIPSLDGIDERTRSVLEPMIETMEKREGVRRRTREKFVTFQDLIDMGLITEAEADDQIAV